MTKDIKYTGYTAQPSDYECPDGDLEFSLNLLNEDGSIKPIGTGKKILQLAANERLLMIHSVPSGQKNYIILRNGTTLMWMRKMNDDDNSSASLLIGQIPAFKDMAIIGNTLCIATDGGMRYVLWKDGSYLMLGERPPFVSVEFGMKSESTFTQEEKFRNVPIACVPKSSSGGSTTHGTERSFATKSDLAEVSNMVLGQLLTTITDKVVSQGFFYQPFFVRYAFRLYDGSYIYHSAPVLMLPTTLVPQILVSETTAGDDGEHCNVRSIVETPAFSLYYRILNDDFNNLANWKDIVVGIDFFISAPIYTYNQSKDLQQPPYISEYYFYRHCLPSTYVQNSFGINTDRGRGDDPASRGDSDDNPSIESSDTKFFIGHYADVADGSKYEDHFKEQKTLSRSKYYWCIERNERFLEDITSAHDFYKIAELKIDEITAMDAPARLKLTANDLSNLVSRPTLPDDYLSHCRLSPHVLHGFNARLNLANVTLRPAEPLPIRSCIAINDKMGLASSTGVSIKVWTRVNGVRCCATHISTALLPDRLSNSECPRFIFYPDASAYKMEIDFGQKVILNLTPHDFLNGAYYFGGLDVDPAPKNNAEPESGVSDTSANMPSKIYTSDVNNPFVFRAANINTVGNGTVLALSSAAKALSQGQFGQFPLYAFTSEGIWALEPSSTGSFVARQPITRDVCINPSGIAQIDSAVLFPSDRGIMLLSGSQAQCISDIIDNSDNDFGNNSANCLLKVLPHLDRLHTMLNQGSDSCMPLAPIGSFLSLCRISYDYTHQRIIIFKPQSNGSTYAYVYSLRTKRWGLMRSKLMAPVNSYPDAYTVDNQGCCIDLSSSADTIEPGMLVTRPFKLDMPDILKTIDSVIQRGRFRKGHVQSVLYGSRDLYNWSLVWSSRDHIMRGFRGTPYKYFCIALVCNLGKDESISGFTTRFTPRMINQPR